MSVALTVRPRTQTALGVAIVAPPWYEVPPATYGGIEAVCDAVARGLQHRGHDVVLLLAGRPHPTIPSISVLPEPAEGLGGPDAAVIEAAYAARVSEILRTLPVDVIHDHSTCGSLLAPGRSTPTVVTAHGPVTGANGELLRALGAAIHPVAISRAQRDAAPDLGWAATIHNGIDVATYPFVRNKGDHLVFLGRLHPQKGPHLAIDAARRAGRRLLIAARCAEPLERAYFADEIRPRLGPDVEYLGEADAADKRRLLAEAAGLLFPIRWAEPFGLVMIEALACGTPVVALAGGSVREVIRDGVTGFVREHPEELPAAIDRLPELSPDACRHEAQQRFDGSVMVDAYERILLDVVARTTRTDAALAPAV